MSHQEEIFSIILSEHAKSSICKTMISLLGISKSTAYKVMNMEKDLSYNEMERIKTYFQINPRKTVSNPIQVEWAYPRLIQQSQSPINFLRQIHSLVADLEPEKTSIKLSFFEIPIFYYLYFPSLFAFKLYCWDRTVWNLNRSDHKKFSPDVFLTSEMMNLIETTSNHFNLVNSIEYWGEGMLDNTTRQIIYFDKLGALSSDILKFRLIDDIKSLLRLMYSITKDRRKRQFDQVTLGATTDVYINDMYFTNNIILAETDATRRLYSVFDNPNFMFTEHQGMINRTVEWIEDMRKSSTSLTHNNELVRNTFFQRLEKRLEFTIQNE